MAFDQEMTELKKLKNKSKKTNKKLFNKKN